MTGSLSSVAERYENVLGQISDAAESVGRAPSEVRLVAVSKFHPFEAVLAALQAGQRDFGENRVQEAYGKWQQSLASELSVKPRWSLIGPLQTNKAGKVAEFASEFQALDSGVVAVALNRRLALVGRTLDVLVQVNTSGEATKSGIAPDDAALERLLSEIAGLEQLRVRGLMTIGPNVSAEKPNRVAFALLRDLGERARTAGLMPADATELSMGMSGDFGWAIAEGSTIVRIGTAIFGPRPV